MPAPPTLPPPLLLASLVVRHIMAPWHRRHRFLAYADLILNNARAVKFDPKANLWFDMGALASLVFPDDTGSFRQY